VANPGPPGRTSTIPGRGSTVLIRSWSRPARPAGRDQTGRGRLRRRADAGQHNQRQHLCCAGPKRLADTRIAWFKSSGSPRPPPTDLENTKKSTALQPCCDKAPRDRPTNGGPGHRPRWWTPIPGPRCKLPGPFLHWLPCPGARDSPARSGPAAEPRSRSNENAGLRSVLIQAATGTCPSG